MQNIVIDQSIEDSIKEALKKNNATLVAHYYVSSDLQILAEETGGIVSDSLEMARFGQNSDCLLYTSPSPRDYAASRMPSSA